MREISEETKGYLVLLVVYVFVFFGAIKSAIDDDLVYLTFYLIDMSIISSIGGVAFWSWLRKLVRRKR